mgnify:CR=1 FL=1
MNNKSLKITIFVAFVFSITSCIKQIEKQFTGTSVAEIDAAVLNTTFTGVGYPVLARYPRPGLPISTTNSTSSCEIPQADSTLRRLGLGRTISIRVNLVGPQSTEERTVGYRIITSSPITTFDFPATVAAVTTSATTCGTSATFAAQLPAVAAGNLAITNAVSGTHFGALSGKVTIPANSSFGNIQIQLLNSIASAGQGRFLGIQLDSTGTVLPSLNYRTLGLVIDQR